MSSFFLDLIDGTDEARRAFETNPRILDIVARGLPLDRYRSLLLELYHIVWHFNPICAAAASRMPDQFRELRYFLYEHTRDESGHELWVLNDLEAVGVPRSDALTYRPSASVMGFVGFNYWTADRRHPCGALGMVYALEVIASVYGGPISTAIKDSLLLDEDRGITFISSHATLDAEHMAQLRSVLNPIADREAKDAIIESTSFNFAQFTRILERI